jgi:hypothetical protein
MAGTGKSTIARTVARACADKKRLGASFFFSRGQGDLGHAARFFSSIAVQLANTLPTLKPYVCKAVAENPDISQRGLSEQWKHLIFQPLVHLNAKPLQPQLFVVVIDALDECEGDDDIRLILRLLSEAKALNGIRLRVFVTSRPETPIRCGFLNVPEHEDFVLQNISPSILRQDMFTFFHHELERIRKERSLPADWPIRGHLELLVQRADRLFIYAATICRFIQDRKFDPRKRLSIVLEGAAARQSSTGALDVMYTQVLNHSVIGNCEQQEKEELLERFRQIVGPIILLSDSLPADALARLLHKEDWEIDVTLDSLRSVLSVPENQLEDPGIRLLHPSFRDFLLDEQRCLDLQFWIDEKATHSYLSISCLELMSGHLKRDMCNLRLPGTIISDVANQAIDNYVPLDVRYACCYWIYHLQRGNIELCDNGNVHVFFQKHFLHWLEVLSLIGKISDGVLAVMALQSMLAVSNTYTAPAVKNLENPA